MTITHILLLVVLTVFAQFTLGFELPYTPDFIKQFAIPNAYSSGPSDTTFDTQGYMYITGQVGALTASSYLNIPTQLKMANPYDIDNKPFGFIIKFDKAGGAVWQTRVASNKNSILMSRIITFDSSLCVIGQVSGSGQTLCFGNSCTGAEEQTVPAGEVGFMACFSTDDGSFLWHHTIAATSVVRADDIVKNNGFIYFSLFVNGQTRIGDDADTTSTDSDAWVLEYTYTNSPATFSYSRIAHKISGVAGSLDRIFSIQFDSSGDMYMIGFSQSVFDSASFIPSSLSSTVELLVVKFKNTNFEWMVRSTNSQAAVYGHSLHVDEETSEVRILVLSGNSPTITVSDTAHNISNPEGALLLYYLSPDDGSLIKYENLVAQSDTGLEYSYPRLVQRNRNLFISFVQFSSLHPLLLIMDREATGANDQQYVAMTEFQWNTWGSGIIAVDDASSVYWVATSRDLCSPISIFGEQRDITIPNVMVVAKASLPHYASPTLVEDTVVSTISESIAASLPLIPSISSIEGVQSSFAGSVLPSENIASSINHHFESTLEPSMQTSPDPVSTTVHQQSDFPVESSYDAPVATPSSDVSSPAHQSSAYIDSTSSQHPNPTHLDSPLSSVPHSSPDPQKSSESPFDSPSSPVSQSSNPSPSTAASPTPAHSTSDFPHVSPSKSPAQSSDFPQVSAPPIAQSSTPVQASTAHSSPLASSPPAVQSSLGPFTVEIGLPNSFQLCANALFKSLLSYELNGATYRWNLQRIPAQGMAPQTSTSKDALFPFGSLQAGTYKVTLQVELNGDIIGSAEEEVTKADYKFGPSCNDTISFAPSFEMKPIDGGRIIVDRMSRLFIKAAASPGYSFSWFVDQGNSRRSVAAQCTDPLCSLVTTSLSSNEGFVLQPGSTGLKGSMNFNVRLSLSKNGEIVYNRVIPLTTSYEEATPLASGSKGFTVTSNLRPDPNTIKLGLNGYSLVTDFNLTAIIGSSVGWDIRGGEVVTFIYSYLNLKTNEFVPLATSTQGNIVTKLPSGYGTNHELTIRLRVLNQWGVSAFATNVVRVASQTIGPDVKSVTELADAILLNKGNTTEFVSGAVSIATYLNQNADRISTVNKATFEKVIDSLLDFTAELVNITDLSTVNETTIQQQVTIVEVLTKTPSILSTSAKNKALSIVNTVIAVARKQENSTAHIGLATFTQVAKVISNIVAGGFRDPVVASNTFSTANDLAKTILEGKLVTESATTIVTENFEMVVRRDKAQSLSNSRVETSNNETKTLNVVQIPNNFAYDITDDENDAVSYTMLVFNSNPFQYSNPDAQQGIATPVIDFTFLFQNGSIIPVRNLSEPLVMQMSKPSRCDLKGEKATFDCRYWDEIEQIWKSDGCYWVPEDTTDTSVGCRCNHTTSFSAFLLTKGKCPEWTPGLNISGIVFNTIYVLLCVPILISLFAFRDLQPVRSRYIAPFIGISAILVDAVLNGWVKNALLLAKEWDASDAFAYVVMLTSNPLSAVAMYVFLWQQVRFVLLQNLYYLMATENSALQKKILQFSRIMTSKLIFAVSSLLLGAVVFVYFLICVIIAATRKTASGTDAIITVQAISFLLIVIALGIGILVALIADIVLSFTRSRTYIGNTSSGENNEVMATQQAKGINVLVKNVKNDALLFRMEAGFIVVAVIVMFILYSIGVATLYREGSAKSPSSIVRVTIEYIYMFLSIIAFGGFVSVAGFKSWLRRRESGFSFVPEEHEQSSNPHDEFLLNILKDQAGFNMFHKYCTIEFSLENLLLWQELEELRTTNLIMSPAERKASLDHIQELYIKTNAERELNLSNAAKRVFNRIVELEQPNVAEAEEAYCKLYGVCMSNLGDTFTRLSTSEAYRRYNETRAHFQELQSDFQHSE